MKIAIHHRLDSFSGKWIDYCKSFHIDYKVVNCYDADIIEQLEDCDGLMWHWSHLDSKAILFARQLILSLEHAGKKVFPNSRTCWHFDDKIGQKYLLEALKAPLVKTTVFYDKKNAMEWANHTLFPKVFKLRGGAGSVNVELVLNRRHAKNLIKKAFGKGFRAKNRKNSLQDRYLNFLKYKNLSSFLHLIKGYGRILFPSIDESIRNRERGYIYFQEFIPNNDFDIRVIVIGNRAFAIKRLVRNNDFKASGSGKIIYSKEEIPINCIISAFEWADKLKSQCVAFDYIFNNNELYFLEISYGFTSRGYLNCPGFWDQDLKWHENNFTPEWFIIEDFIKSLPIAQ